LVIIFQIRLFVFWTLSCLVSITIVSLNATKLLPSFRVPNKNPPTLNRPDKIATTLTALKSVYPPDELGRHGTLTSLRHSEQAHKESPEEDSQRYDIKLVKRSGASTSVRKQFHLLAIFEFLPGLFIDTEMTYMAVSCALIVLVMLEVCPFHERGNVIMLW